MENILYVSAFPHIGGGEVSLQVILKHLDKNRFRPYVICYAEGALVETLKQQGIAVFVFQRGSFFSNFMIIWKLARFIKRYSIRLVHVNSLDIRAGVAAWFAAVPCIGHVRVIYPFSWRDHLFVVLARKLIAVSLSAADSLDKGKKYKAKFSIIANAVEIPEYLPFDRAELRRQLSIPESALLIGAVGRIHPVKGYEYFIEAAAAVRKGFPDAYFAIFADIHETDPDKKQYLHKLQERVKQLHMEDRFLFPGFRRDILPVIAGFDITVVPSIAIKSALGILTEGFGRVAIESMAMGVCVVASRVGGLAEIIEDGKSGVLVEPGNVVALVEALGALLKDPAGRLTLQQEALKRFKSFYTVSKHIRSIEKVYAEVSNREAVDTPCQICGGYAFKVKEDSGGGYKVLQCLGCQFACVRPLPPDELLQVNYAQDYYKPWITQQRQSRITMWQNRLKQLNSVVSKKGKLLDVGCGDGLFLETARNAGWRVFGTEFSSYAVSYIKEKYGIKVFQGDITAYESSGNEFDAVTLWHVLEHTKDPAAVMKKIHSLLKDTGVLILAVPNLDNWFSQGVYRLVKGKNQHLFSPLDRELHLNFFKKETLVALLETSGFEVIAVSGDCNGARWQEHGLNLVNSFFSFISGRLCFDSLEVYARPRLEKSLPLQ
ncbi:MAG: glycosyltransferase [Candidatus Omnitrophota bacterium]|jgi:glycosyltransferase involved in cell wall biosynthesis/2-polyprenyl-3-methyl-5-hydroxy-6-metoxy-1,4-benzoquinol methylase